MEMIHVCYGLCAHIRQENRPQKRAIGESFTVKVHSFRLRLAFGSEPRRGILVQGKVLNCGGVHLIELLVQYTTF